MFDTDHIYLKVQLHHYQYRTKTQNMVDTYIICRKDVLTIKILGESLFYFKDDSWRRIKIQKGPVKFQTSLLLLNYLVTTWVGYFVNVKH